MIVVLWRSPSTEKLISEVFYKQQGIKNIANIFRNICQCMEMHYGIKQCIFGLYEQRQIYLTNCVANTANLCPKRSFGIKFFFWPYWHRNVAWRWRDPCPHSADISPGRSACMHASLDRVQLPPGPTLSYVRSSTISEWKTKKRKKSLNYRLHTSISMLYCDFNFSNNIWLKKKTFMNCHNRHTAVMCVSSCVLYISVKVFSLPGHVKHLIVVHPGYWIFIHCE